MKKKVLLFNGSPHKDGAIAQISNCMLAEFSSAGWDIQSVNLYQASLKPCLGCMVCRETGNCVIDDDIGKIRTMMQQSDVVVMAAPVYFANVPGTTKNLMDRLSGVIINSDLKPRMKKTQRYILVTACNTPTMIDRIIRQSGGAIRAMKAFFSLSGMTYVGKIVHRGAKSSKQLTHANKEAIKKIVGSCN